MPTTMEGPIPTRTRTRTHLSTRSPTHPPHQLVHSTHTLTLPLQVSVQQSERQKRREGGHGVHARVALVVQAAHETQNGSCEEAETDNCDQGKCAGVWLAQGRASVWPAQGRASVWLAQGWASVWLALGITHSRFVCASLPRSHRIVLV